MTIDTVSKNDLPRLFLKIGESYRLVLRLNLVSLPTHRQNRMQIEIYQWLVPLIGLIYIFRTVRQYLRKKRSVRNMAVWVIFWLTIILLAIVPNEISFKIADLLGFKNNVNAIIFVALGLLFLLVFYLSSTIERLENQITELVRKMALEDKDKD